MNANTNITEIKADILKLTNVAAITNAVNCKGIMGKGLALQFKRQLPNAYFVEYQAACRKGVLKPGKVQLYRLSENTQPQWIVNFPTKDDPHNPSRLDYIERGVVDLVRVPKEKEITSIALPRLGCGLGGLDWKLVKPMIVNAFANTTRITVVIVSPEFG